MLPTLSGGVQQARAVKTEQQRWSAGVWLPEGRNGERGGKRDGEREGIRYQWVAHPREAWHLPSCWASVIIWRASMQACCGGTGSPCTATVPHRFSSDR
eukprot:364282-Chlamydomonas_euryale.AAC.52